VVVIIITTYPTKKFLEVAMYCYACGIGIGDNHLEKTPYQIGDKIICSKCRIILSFRKIKIDDSFLNECDKQGELIPNKKIKYLYPDGEVRHGRLL
jgi:hypothetical protein